MTHLNTTAQQISMTLPQRALPCKLTKETSQKNLYWTLVLLVTLFRGYYILLTNSTEIKNGIDIFQRENPEQEPTKTDTDT